MNLQIACESCGTTYELDDSLLPAQGAPVQCTTCNHVFFARPGWAERTMMGQTGQMAVKPSPPSSMATMPDTPVGAPVPVDAPLSEEPQAGATMMMRAPVIPRRDPAPPAGAPVPVDAPLSEEPQAGATMMMRVPVIPRRDPAPPAGAPVLVDAPLSEEPQAGATMMMRVPMKGKGTAGPESATGEHDTVPDLPRGALKDALAAAQAPAPPVAEPPAGATVVYRVPNRLAHQEAAAESESSPASPLPANKKKAARPPPPEPDEEAPPPRRARPAPAAPRRGQPPRRAPQPRASAGRGRTALVVAVVAISLLALVAGAGILFWPQIGPLLGLRRHEPDPAAAAKAQAAFEALLKDDGPNFERAAQYYAEAIAADPKFVDAVGDRALALMMQAVELRTEADFHLRKAAQKEAQLAQAKNPTQRTILEDEIRRLKTKADPLKSKADALVNEAFETARKVASKSPKEPSPRRALAYYYAVEGDPASAAKFSREAARERPDDALTLYVAAVATAAGGDKETAATLLKQALAKEPRLLRAHYELARVKNDRAALQAVRSANSFHMRAQWLQDEWGAK